MTTKTVPLNSEKHRNLKVTAAINFDLVKDQYLIPVFLQEFVVAATEFPIVFVKNEQTGAFQAVAMAGIEPKENLYCKKNNWDGHYIPRVIRSYPFSLAFKDRNKGEFFVCIDEGSSLLNKKGGEALFTDSGEQTDYLKKLTENMVRDAENSQLTTGFVNYLVEKELLTSYRLTIDIKNERRNIDGLYMIDETKLNKLPASEFESLRQRGVLFPIYAQMGSLNQIPRLIKRKQEQMGG
jgi:hypothetical protein